MSADAPPPHASALIFDQPKTPAAALLEQLDKAAFRVVEPVPARTAESPANATDNPFPDTGIKKPKLSRKNVAPDTGIKDSETVGTPQAKKAKPPTVAGFVWRSDGAGWQLRKHITEPDGKRRQVYVSYLSKDAFQQMKRRHRNAQALADALTEWAKGKQS